MNFFTDGLVWLLGEIYRLTGSFGWSITIFTIITRALLLPLSLPGIKIQKKMQDIKPHLKEINEKHKDDKKALQMAQIELYRQHNINPLAGCLPQIIQLVLLIVLYQVLDHLLKTKEIGGVLLNTQFFWLDLTKPDHTYIVSILAGVSQLFLSVMMMSGIEDIKEKAEKADKKKIIKEKEPLETEKSVDTAEMMQKQMLIMMPVMTAVAAASFPSGLGVYWIVTTFFSIGQQYAFTGWGGIALYSKKLIVFVKKVLDKKA